MQPLTITKIKSEDIDEFIEVLMNVFENKFKVVFKSKMEIGKNLLIQEMKNRELEDIYLAKEDELIVGAITLKIRKPRKQFSQTLKIFIKYLGFYHGLRSFFVGGYHHSIYKNSIHKNACYIDNAFVLPDYRRKGIAMNLMKQAEEFAKKQNKIFLYSFVETTNSKTIKLCLKSGFKKMSVKKSILSKLFFNDPSWIYLKKELN